MRSALQAPLHAAACALSIFAAGCTEGVTPPKHDGGGGGGNVDSGGVVDDGGAYQRPDGLSTNHCLSAASDYIYLVTDDRQLLRFAPNTLTLEPMGPVSCDSPFASPFSMAVDRSARAWVLHGDGRIFWIDLTDPSLPCTASPFVPGTEGFTNFGMGFVAPDGSEVETLFIAGGSPITFRNGMPQGFAAIDPITMTVQRRGEIAAAAELTGTGAGTLWGFLPDLSPPTIREIDPATGATLTTTDASVINGGSGSGFAFAFWGGNFYVFHQGSGTSSSDIWRFIPDPGDLSQVKAATGYRIVGAGVSTCAPTIPI